jgi:predicted DNA-binding transcriptional regulator YafY
MNRQKKSPRIFRLFQLIREMRTPVRQTPIEIRARLGVSKSQFQRDCQLLRTHGFVFHYDRSAGTYVVDEDATLPTSDLTIDEIFALVLVLQQMAGTSSTYVAAQAVGAGNKLLGSFRKEGMPNICGEVNLSGVLQDIRTEERVFHDLNRAIAGRERVVITYRKPGQTAQDVEIEPYHLYLCDGFTYLDGWSVPRRGMRRYKVCRIKRVRETGVRFSDFHGYDFLTHQKTAFNIFAGEQTQRVCIRFSSDIRPYIEEYNLHESQISTRLPDGSLQIELKVAQPREVMWWALQWGAEAEILEPGWLRQEAREIVGRMQKVYDKK